MIKTLKVPVNNKNHFMSVKNHQDHCCVVIGAKKLPTMHRKASPEGHVHAVRVSTAIYDGNIRKLCLNLNFFVCLFVLR